MTWFLWALAASFCAAALAECNRIFRLDAQMMNAWRATIGVGLLLVAIPYMEWPTGKWFYIIATMDGVVTAIGMILFFRLAMKRTGRVSSMIIPIAAISAYMLWWMMMPDQRPDLHKDTFKVFLATMSATTVMIAFQKVRGNDANWESFLIVLPVGAAFGIMDALAKLILEAQPHAYRTSMAYGFLEMVACAVGAWLAAIPKPAGGRTMGFFNKDLLWGAFCAGFFTVGMALFSIFALTLAPHPAMPGIIMTCTPIWLYILNHIRNTEDDASLAASALIVLGAIGLLLSTL